VPDRSNSIGVELSEIIHAADSYLDSEGLSISGKRKKNKDQLWVLSQLGLGKEDPSLFQRFHNELDMLLSVL
jgi:hypothetical protein